MWRRIWATTQKEFIQLWRNRLVLPALTVGPILELILFAVAIHTDVKHIPLVVADQSMSAASREYLSAFTVSDSFDIVSAVSSEADVVHAVDSGQAGLGLVVPPDFATRVAHKDASVLLVVDGSDSFVSQSDYDKVQWLPWVSSTQQSLALQQATNNYRQARANLDYLLTNRPDVTPSKINLDLAKLGVFDAQFGLDTAQSTLNKTTLVAPFDGTITAINVDVGEMPACPAIRMITADDLEVVLNLDEADVRSLTQGQPATITLDAWPDSQVEGKVIYISPEALTGPDNTVVNYEVRLSVGKTDLPLRAGLNVEATITTFSYKDVLLVPSSAIIADREAGKYYVNLVTPQGRQKSEVTIGTQDGAHTRIINGLQAGDEVEINSSIHSDEGQNGS